MTQDQWIILCLKIVLISGIIAILAFVFTYSVLAPWWKNQIGRTIIAKDILLVLAFMPTTMSLFFNFSRLTSYVAAWADVGLFGLITPVMLWRVGVWVKIHRAKNRAEIEEDIKEAEPRG